MINRISSVAATVALLFVASCGNEQRPQIDATHSTSLEELNSILAGEWQSSMAEYEMMYFLPSVNGSKDSNVVRFSTGSMTLYTVDSIRADGVLSWQLKLLYKSGDTSFINIKRITSDTLIIEEAEGLITGTYIKKHR